MILCYNILLIILTNIHINAEILIDSDGGYKNIIVGLAPNLDKSNIDSILSQLKATLRKTSEALFVASLKNVFFKEVILAIPREYKTWISNKNLLDEEADVKSIRKPDFYLNDDDIFKKPYTIQNRGCGKHGLRISIPVDFLMSSANRKASSLVRQWAHYRYGVFSESGFSDDKIYPACYRIPGSNEIRISDCTNGEAAYEFENTFSSTYENFHDVCTPVPIAGKNGHITSSIMTSIDFPEMNYFCDGDSRPHNRNSPTKQNALCRERSTWEVISSHDDFKIKSKDTSNVKPGFKYVVESDPNFVVAVDTSSDMDLNDRMIMAVNAFSYFVIYDLPYNSTVRLIDMKNKDGNIIEKTISSESDAKWLTGMFPETDALGDTCVHCTIQKLLEDLKLDIHDIIIITATDITSSWIDNITAMLKSNKVALHVIYFEKKLRHPAFLERIARNSGGNFFHIPEAFPPGSSVSSLTHLYEAFRLIYESFSWLNIKRVLVDQMTFSNNCSPKCVLSFPSDPTMQSLQVVITGIEFGRNSPVLRKSIVLSNGTQQFISGNDSFVYESEIPAYIIRVQNPQSGRWNLTLERKPGFNKPVIAIIRATSRDYGDIINMQSWISKDDSKNIYETARPPITVFSEIKKGNSPVTDVEVTAWIHQTTYNSEWSLKLKDSGDGDPDITRNDGIFSRYLTGIAESGYFSITIIAEKKILNRNVNRNGEGKGNDCCGSFIPDYLSYDSGYFKRVTTYQSFFVSQEKAGITYPPRRVVDLRIEKIETLSNYMKCYVLKWTAPGENYDKGKALSYHLKVFSNRKDALENFQNTSVLNIGMLNIQGPLLEPLEAGTMQTAYVALTEELTSGTYFIALKTEGHSGQLSDVSNVVELAFTATDGGFSDGVYYTRPIDGTTETMPDGQPQGSDSTNLGLAIGLSCGFLLLFLMIGLILFVYFERRKKQKKKKNPSSSINQTTKKTESNDTLCRKNGDASISIISPVTSWGANSLVMHYETLQRQKETDSNAVSTTPGSKETDSISLASSKFSYDNKIEPNTIYDPVYYHQVRSQDHLNYPYNPGYTPFDPTYTSSLRRLDNSNIIDNPYCADNASYCSYSLNRSQLSRLKTDV